ncbi:MAG: ABC transporter substrate-binding protein [Victivallaceae bacterium]
MDKKNKNSKNQFQKFGLFMAGFFYLVSVIAVYVNSSGEKLLDPSLKTITFAHWNLEDGFREGYDEAIKMFEEYKASQGEKVKVIQTTVPWRGYPQWFLTQLIGGEPADILKLQGTDELYNQYFIPLSPYISQPNPFNKGTPFEKIPWKDTFHDNMKSALNSKYGEYYGIGAYSSVFRIYVNMELLKNAAGTDKLPQTLSEWFAACEKLKEYGEKTGEPIIPIGVRGFDKATLNYLFVYYFSQMNSDINDNISEACYPYVTSAEILDALKNGKLDYEKIITAVDIVKKIGRYFGKGFMATDLEQTKFLFFAGRVGFFPEGTWNAYSMVKNAPFKVGIMEFPTVGVNSPYAKYFAGRTTEQGLGVAGLFGIPKASKNFDLALEFLLFTTSWKINQMIMVDYCKWLPAVKKANYKGILKYCKPQIGSGRRMVEPPFWVSSGSQRRMLESLEMIIIKDKEAEKTFWNDFINKVPLEIEECREVLLASQRTLLELEKQRSSITLDGLRTDIHPVYKQRLDIRYELIQETLISSYNNIYNFRKLINILNELKTKDSK